MNLNPIELWEPTGLLNGVDDSTKLRLANLYDSMAQHITNLDEENEIVDDIIFTIIYRITNSGGTINYVGELYDDVLKFVESNIDDVSNLSNNYDFYIDVDAELIGMYVENYLNKYGR